MFIFHLPLGVCRRLNKQVARFWWGNTRTGSRRVHWQSWRAISRPKLEGGLGFRDFISMNQSMLAKLCSRLLQDPNSLVAQILKGRYFPHGTLLTATKGSYPSWGWSSILHGRELLLNGSRWMVGDGTNISTLLDIWLPTSPPAAPTPLPTTCPIPLTVSGLILHGRWNESLIRQLFHPSTVGSIVSIPLPSIQILDAWIWHYTNTGLYSVSSGYRLAEYLRPTVSSKLGPSLLDSRIWACLWGFPIQPKLKFFV
ncbi:Uncharacterized mitochondrial protein AtMg00310 [Linum grandiflorum]